MYKLTILLILLLAHILSESIFAQGSALILPMSKYTTDTGDAIRFQINNLQQEQLSLQLTLKCEVDGREIEGKECDQYFSLQLDGQVNEGIINISPSSSNQGKVELKEKPSRYGFFKPLFSPANKKDTMNRGLSFEFNYQIGYLFITNPEMQKFEAPIFSTYSTKESRVARFSLDLNALSMPTVATISVRIIDREKKKMIRFVRMANEKILDPKRKNQTLEAAFAEPSDKTDVCYEMILQLLPNSQIQRIGDCPVT